MQPQYSTLGNTESTITKQVQIASAGAINSCSARDMSDDIGTRSEARSKIVSLAPRGVKQPVSNVEYEFSGIAG